MKNYKPTKKETFIVGKIFADLKRAKSVKCKNKIKEIYCNLDFEKLTETQQKVVDKLYNMLLDQRYLTYLLPFKK
ncbi:MAG: hypothetical protein NT155_03660 [Candidatus Staskawiczbacteria bacterium]|nr:hypothetical protein [Candidatus Staskawiczbacteria bacterium]